MTLDSTRFARHLAALAAALLAFSCGPTDPNENTDPSECAEEPCDEPCEGDDCEEADPCDPNPCAGSDSNRGRCAVDGEGNAECLCDAGYHEYEELCCPANSSASNGACLCDAGYEDQGGVCLPVPEPCSPNPCTGAGLHRNICVEDASEEGYRCECNEGYEELDSACVLSVWESCPDELVCRADVCVPQDLSSEQCLTDDDCRESPGASSFCNASAAGGICLGCFEQSDCPSGTECTIYGTCALPCDDDTDCPHGRCYVQTGYCGQARCTTSDDCRGGTVCIDESGDGQGMCLRIPCNELECSPTNPAGTCDPGAVCLYGACQAGCDPNPCTVEPNKTVCVLDEGVPSCRCAAGYEAQGGDCVPVSIDCPIGFSCSGGYCADSTEEAFACAIDADCGAGLTCSPTLPAGTCSGCADGKPCPEGFVCLHGYCLRSCQSPDDCHTGMVCGATGFCGRKECAGPTDCPEPYVCVTGTSGGTCNRATCEG